MSANPESVQPVKVRRRSKQVLPPVEPNYGEPITDPDITPPTTDPVAPVSPDVPVVVTPGIKTTEFYLTALLVIVSAAKVIGFDLDSVRAESLATLVALAAPGVIALLAYIRKRAEVKKEVVRANATLRAARMTYNVRSK